MLNALYSLLFLIKKKILLQDCKRTICALRSKICLISLRRHIEQRALKSCRLMAQMFHQSLSDMVATGCVCLFKLKSNESYKFSPQLHWPLCKCQQPSFPILQWVLLNRPGTEHLVSFCKYFYPAYSPFGKCNTLCKELHLIVILHEIPLSIDVATLCGFPQAVQGSLSVLADTLSVEVHEPQGTLGLQVSIATSFWMPIKCLRKSTVP